MRSQLVRSVGVNTNLNRVNYIEWLDVSSYQNDFYSHGEFNPKVMLVTAGLVYSEDTKFVGTALNYVENNRVTGLSHVPQGMINYKKELILKPFNLNRKVSLELGQCLVLRIKYLDASKTQPIMNGTITNPGITCWACGILMRMGDGTVTLAQDWSPQNNTFRELLNIPNVCIKEVYGAKQKITRETLKIINEK